MDFLVEFLKQREDWPRAFTVERALPDDTRLVGVIPQFGYEIVELELESEAWEGDGELREPTVYVHLLDPVKMAQCLRQ